MGLTHYVRVILVWFRLGVYREVHGGIQGRYKEGTLSPVHLVAVACAPGKLFYGLQSRMVGSLDGIPGDLKKRNSMFP